MTEPVGLFPEPARVAHAVALPYDEVLDITIPDGFAQWLMRRVATGCGRDAGTIATLSPRANDARDNFIWRLAAVELAALMEHFPVGELTTAALHEAVEIGVTMRRFGATATIELEAGMLQLPLRVAAERGVGPSTVVVAILKRVIPRRDHLTAVK